MEQQAKQKKANADDDTPLKPTIQKSRLSAISNNAFSSLAPTELKRLYDLFSLSKFNKKCHLSYLVFLLVRTKTLQTDSFEQLYLTPDTLFYPSLQLQICTGLDPILWQHILLCLP